MPLVLMCGLPCSGKSSRAQSLERFLMGDHGKNVQIIGDESIQIDKNEVYSDSKKEKEIRGTLKSAVQRKISKDDVVILDSLNYIKGFRYELHCVTKACQTPSCVIYCDIHPDQAKEWNEKRPETERYTEEIFQALSMRFEPPNSQHRWDSPLFIVHPDDDLPCQQIYEALYHSKAPPPNLSTQAVVVAAQKTAIAGDQIAVPGATDKINLTRTLSLAELQRLRRQFITYTKMHTVKDTSKLPNMFVQYLNNTIQ